MTEPLRSRAAIRGFYDDPTVVDTYLERRTTQPLNAVLHARQVAFLNRALARLAPERVLELAPGPGRLAAEVTQRPVMVGMDASPRMLAEARRRTRARGLSWDLVRGDAFHLPFAGGSFDLVYGLRFVRHFDRAGRANLYGEIRRVLRPGGHLVLDAQNRLVAEPHRLARGLDRYPVYDELWGREELVEELRGAGLVPVEIEGLMRRFEWQWRLNRLRRVRLGSVARVLIRALELGPDDNPSTWMLLCRSVSA